MFPISGAAGTGVDWVLDELLEAIGPEERDDDTRQSTTRTRGEWRRSEVRRPLSHDERSGALPARFLPRA